MYKLGLAIVAVASILAGDAEARDPLLQHFEGTWGTPGTAASCEKNASTIRFSDDGSEMRMSYAPSLPGKDGAPATSGRYEVLGVAGNSVRMTLDGETRTTSDGDLVVWDLVSLSDESYCWHRADWEPGACTPPRLRCESILDDYERAVRRSSSDALSLLEAHDYVGAANMFGLPLAIPESERPDEYRRLAKSLAVVIREFGVPLDWSEVVQHEDKPPEVVNLSVGPSHVVVSQEHGTFFIAFFAVRFRSEGDGFFRATFDSAGDLAQMTFSLPREQSERLAEIGEILLRETGSEL